MTDYATYSVGTISVTNGSTACAGAGGMIWLTAVKDGDALTVLGAGTDKLPYAITIGADDAITFDRPYEGTTGTGLAYIIFRTSGFRNSARAASQQLSQFLDAVTLAGGNVVGPASAIDGHIVQFDGVTGKLLKDGLALDIDGTLAANSDTRVASQKAVKTYADQIIAAADAMVFKGVIDCSANPNYPAADRGWTYRVSVAGKIGGASGTNVEIGDLLTCLTDSTASGNQATVGSSWTITQTNIDGAVVGPASATDGHIPQFDGVTGKLLKDGLALDIDGTLAANSDTRIASQKAVKTYVAAHARELLAAPRTYYVRAAGATVNFTNGSASVGWTAHGLSVNDPVVLSILPNKKVVTVTIASPGVFTLVAHGYVAGQPVVFSTTGALPTGLTAGTTYYVISAGLTTDNFEVSTTVGGSAVNTSGSQSGSHFCAQAGAMPTFSTAGLLVAGTVYYVGTVVDANTITLSTTAANANPLGTATVASGSPVYSGSTGSDSNNGLAQTRAGAFLTIQKAIDTVASIDLSIYDVTVQVGDSIYTGLNVISGPFVGRGKVTILGNTTTPSNALLNTAGVAISASNRANISVSGLGLTTSSLQCIKSDTNAIISIDGNMDFGTCASVHILAQAGGKVVSTTAAYTISGAAVRHWQSTQQGALTIAALTITITGTPAFSSQFAFADRMAMIQCNAITFTGSATGTRYSIDNLSLIWTNAAGATYLPGNAGGSIGAGGGYYQ
jgi:hypothetical protein